MIGVVPEVVQLSYLMQLLKLQGWRKVERLLAA
jgi:hypothetical protein